MIVTVSIMFDYPWPRSDSWRLADVYRHRDQCHFVGPILYDYCYCIVHAQLMWSQFLNTAMYITIHLAYHYC